MKPNPGFTLSTVFYSKYIYIRYLAWATFSHETTRNSPGPLAVIPFFSAQKKLFHKAQDFQKNEITPNFLMKEAEATVRKILMTRRLLMGVKLATAKTKKDAPAPWLMRLLLGAKVFVTVCGSESGKINLGKL